MFSKILLFFIGTALIIGITNSSSSNEIEGSSIVSYEVFEETRKRVVEALDLNNWKTIKQWHNVSLDFQYIERDGTFENFIKMINQDCVDEKIKFPKFGENKLNYTMALRLFGSANVLCMEKNGKRAIDVLTKEFVEKIFDEYKIKGFREYRDCFSKKLKELDPTSKLVENFDEDTMTHNSEECADRLGINEKHQSENIMILTHFFGDFSTATCGHFNENDFLRIVFSSPFYAIEDNEELKKSEKQKIDEFIESSVNELYECTVKYIVGIN